MGKIVLVDESLCNGCGKCVKVCPKKILYVDEHSNKCRVTGGAECTGSGRCMKACPKKAIQVFK